jgi:hypothetical protein
MRFALPLCAAIALVSTALEAQPQPTETLLQGPVDDGFVLAPDFKFTDVDGDFANLAGAYGGWILNRKLLLGGGAYTLTNGSDSTGMTYGGAVVEYFVNPSSLVNLSFRGLAGGGSATVGTLGRTRGSLDFARASMHDARRRPAMSFPDGDVSFDSFTRSSSFFVAEPELNVMLNVSQKFRLSFGGGYRFIGGADGLNERLEGFTASAALKLSFF